MNVFKRLLLLCGIIFAGQVFASPSITDALSTSNPLLLSQFIASHSMLLYLGIFFMLGVLLAFTPCVLPMVPILSGIIIKKEKEKSFKLSLSYVLGMAIMYALAGMGAGLAGASLQAALQNPYVLGTFSLVFVALGLNLLGLFEFRLPQIAMFNFKDSRQSYGQTALMGALSTLIVSPCVTAPLIGVLSYIGQTQQVLLGGLILFVMALGMGVPLLLVGAGQGRFLPKSGPWMNAIKALFGFMMLAMAFYLSERFLPSTVMPFLWASLIIFAGLFLALKNVKSHKFVYVIALLLSTFGVVNFTHAVQKANQIKPINVENALFQKANSVKEIHAILAKAKKQKQKVFLEFYASWCSDCVEMDKKVFNQTDVKHAMKDFINVRVDITEDTQNERAIKKAFHIYGTPSLLFYNTQGQFLENLTAAGYVKKQSLLDIFKKV